jgi:hypothetical protein
MSLLELFCDVDDFWQLFRPDWYRHLLQAGALHRVRTTQLTMSEIMTIIIHFHQSGYRDFKTYYTQHVLRYLRAEFPKLVSYPRFVELMPRVLLPLCAYLQQRQGDCTGLSFVDATPLAVCHNRRISRHRVFAGMAQRGKTSMGWFYGFKLNLVVNDCGDLLAWALTPGNLDDRRPVPKLAHTLFGKLVGDKGYVSKPLAHSLLTQGLELITAARRNMHTPPLSLENRLFLRKRAIVETIHDQLKNISQIEHTRHRSPLNFLVNLVAGLIAYTFQPNKPSLNIVRTQLVIPN